jgi:type IV secretory pathway VirB10-like protein
MRQSGISILTQQREKPQQHAFQHKQSLGTNWLSERQNLKRRRPQGDSARQVPPLSTEAVRRHSVEHPVLRQPPALRRSPPPPTHTHTHTARPKTSHGPTSAQRKPPDQTAGSKRNNQTSKQASKKKNHVRGGARRHRTGSLCSRLAPAAARAGRSGGGGAAWRAREIPGERDPERWGWNLACE